MKKVHVNNVEAKKQMMVKSVVKRKHDIISLEVEEGLQQSKRKQPSHLKHPRVLPCNHNPHSSQKHHHGLTRY